MHTPRWWWQVWTVCPCIWITSACSDGGRPDVVCARSHTRVCICVRVDAFVGPSVRACPTHTQTLTRSLSSRAAMKGCTWKFLPPGQLRRAMPVSSSPPPPPCEASPPPPPARSHPSHAHVVLICVHACMQMRAGARARVRSSFVCSLGPDCMTE